MRVLHPLLLELARGDVVEAREAEHVARRIRFGDMVGASADHDADLRLVVDAAGALGQQDGVARPDDRGRRLDEHEGIFRKRLALLGRVVLVVEADADDLRRRHGGEDAVRVALDLVPRFVGLEQLPFEQPPRPAVRGFDHMARRPVVVDPEELPHRAVSCTRFDGALLLGGVVRSKATTA